MSNSTFQLEVVSLEGPVFSGAVKFLVLKGIEGELGIQKGHAELLTQIAPGPIRIEKSEGEPELLYVSGGFLDVRPDRVNILADTVERGEKIDEQAALEAQQKARALLAGGKDTEHLLTDLSEAAAKLRVIQLLRERKGR